MRIERAPPGDEALTVDELAAVVWDAFEVGRRALDMWRARSRPAAGG